MSMRFVVRNTQQIAHALEQFQAKMIPDRPYEVWMKPFRQRRSLDQNAKMHVMIRELAKHLGYSESELKDALKSEYGEKAVMHVGGREMTVPKSTTDYDVKEAGEMIEIIQMIAAETGCVFQNAEIHNAGGQG